jgi:ribonuclease R
VKLETFAAIAQSYGLPFDLDEARTPKGLTRLLARLKGHPAEKPLSFQLLRSLKQASYDIVNVGHFGLASQAYVHFTSPIRRYPDIVAHRRLKQRLAAIGRPAGGFGPPTPEDETTKLVTMAAESSFAERKAMEIEREVTDLYRAFFMRDRVGDVLAGTISAVTSFGIFVVADEPYVEGLVRAEELGDDIFSFDDATLRLVGRRSGRSFALGDTVSVEVLSVSVARRKIDFRLHGHREQAPAGKKRERQGRSERTERTQRRRATGGKRKPGANGRDKARPTPRGRGGKGGRRPRG